MLLWFSRASFGGFLPQQAYKRLRITNRLRRRVPPQPGVYHQIGPYIPVLKERGFTALLVIRGILRIVGVVLRYGLHGPLNGVVRDIFHDRVKSNLRRIGIDRNFT